MTGPYIVSGANSATVHRTMELRRQPNMTDVIVIAGGIICDDVAHLKKQGVAAVDQRGASLDEIVNSIRSSVMQAA